MRQGTPKKDILIKHKLRKDDTLELPMDDAFYEQLHDKIMAGVDQVEMQSPRKWQKGKVFLERSPSTAGHLAKKSAKLALVGFLTSFAVGFIGMTQHLYAQLQGTDSLRTESRVVHDGHKPSVKEIATSQKLKRNKS